MSKVHVVQNHSKGLEAAREAVKAFEDQISKYGMKAVWSGNEATLKGVGASGSIRISDSSVEVQVKLGMVARAAGIDAGRLEGSIKKRLAAALE